MGKLYEILQTYRRYLEHSMASKEDIEKSIGSFTRIFDQSSLEIKNAIVSTLEDWGRDDYVILNGVLALASTLAHTYSITLEHGQLDSLHHEYPEVEAIVVDILRQAREQGYKHQ